MTYTLTLSQDEMDMLINATNIMQMRYKRPEMNEACHKAACDYGELCSKLYYAQFDAMIAQHEE